MTSISSSDRKSESSKLVSSPCWATITEPAVIIATVSSTKGALPRWKFAAPLASDSSSRPLFVEDPVVLSTTTCMAPTVTVLATNAEVTPRARVIPKVRSGGNGENEFARNANTVVTTARDSAIRRSMNAFAHASAALSESSLALS